MYLENSNNKIFQSDLAAEQKLVFGQKVAQMQGAEKYKTGAD